MLTNAGMRDLILRLREKAAALEALCNNLSQERDLLPANVPSDLYEASQSVLSAANSVQEALGEILVRDFLRDPPCRRLPREKWCDKDGPGGFMGHTCHQEVT